MFFIWENSHHEYRRLSGDGHRQRGRKAEGINKNAQHSDLPDHDVLVEIAIPGLNIKDGLAISGRQKIARKVPLIAGIDLAGTVVNSRDPRWATGDRLWSTAGVCPRRRTAAIRAISA